MMYGKNRFLAVIIIIGFLIYTVLVFKQKDVIKEDQKKYYFIPEQILENETEANWERVINSRRKRAEEICEKSPKLLDFEMHENYLMWEKNSYVSFCSNAKAGTSSWSYLLADFAHRVRKGKLSKRNYRNYIKPRDSNLEKFIIFTIVRHPYTRIVSAYRNKFTGKYYKEVRESIIKKYRGNGTSTDLNKWINIMTELGMDGKTAPTFHEFISYVVDSIENCVSSKIDFNCLRYINGHWRPFYARCNPCVTKFNVIGKTETFSRDFQYIKQKSLEIVAKEIWSDFIRNKTSNQFSKKKNMEDFSENFILKNLPIIANDNRYKSLNETYKLQHLNKSKTFTDELTRKFMSLLSENLKKRLRKAYKYDFEIFNYDQFQFG